MKKYLMTGVAALTLCAGFTSCSHDDFEPMTQAQIDKAKYDMAFLNYVGGKIAPNQDWGFGTATTKGLTRSITVNGDVYDKFPSQSDVADKFPTSIPADAVEVSKLLDEYKGKEVPTQWGTTTIWDIYAVYANIVKEGFNLKITEAGTTELGGNYQNAGWNGSATVAYPYNVYVDVDGDVTLKRVGATHFNLYILKGNVTLGADYGEQAGLISVAEGATLNDQRNSVAANQGVQIYNRGIINATNTEKYDIGNFCTVYNEGTFKVAGALTYSPGDANTSYFVNFGDDAVLTAASMTLNSAGNFYNDGTATITGETNVTQAGIYWVNAGHYTTGSMVFSAKNATFYNYCQLLVKGNAHMYDGEFNLMNGSYTEAATAEFDNFIVNMESNSGFNVNGNTDWAAQGDGTYQGFRTSGSNVYVRLGGTTTVAGHKQSLELTGNITYAIKEIVDLGAGNSGVQPTYVFNEGTIAADFDKLTATPNEEDCGATWSTGTTTPDPVPSDEIKYSLRIIAEDLSAQEAGDFDFNDVVFDVEFSETDSHIKVLAAGGELPLFINGMEVHELLGVEKNEKGLYPLVNTRAADGVEVEPYETLLGKAIKNAEDANKDIVITVLKNGEPQVLTAVKGEPAAKLAVGTDFEWLDERTSIKGKYPKFLDWVNGTNFTSEWWK